LLDGGGLRTRGRLKLRQTMAGDLREPRHGSNRKRRCRERDDDRQHGREDRRSIKKLLRSARTRSGCGEAVQPARACGFELCVPSTKNHDVTRARPSSTPSRALLLTHLDVSLGADRRGRRSRLIVGACGPATRGAERRGRSGLSRSRRPIDYVRRAGTGSGSAP